MLSLATNFVVSFCLCPYSTKPVVILRIAYVRFYKKKKKKSVMLQLTIPNINICLTKYFLLNHKLRDVEISECEIHMSHLRRYPCKKNDIYFCIFFWKINYFLSYSFIDLFKFFFFFTYLNLPGRERKKFSSSSSKFKISNNILAT